MVIWCYFAKCLFGCRLDTGHWLGLGIQHNGHVVGLYCRYDNAVLQWVGNVHLIENVLTMSKLLNELRVAGTLHDGTLWQLIEVVSEHDI